MEAAAWTDGLSLERAVSGSRIIRSGCAWDAPGAAWHPFVPCRRINKVSPASWNPPGVDPQQKSGYESTLVPVCQGIKNCLGRCSWRLSAIDVEELRRLTLAGSPRLEQ